MVTQGKSSDQNCRKKCWCQSGRHVQLNMHQCWWSCPMWEMVMSEWVSKRVSEYGLTSPSTHYRSFQRRVFPVNHLHWYWQPNKNKWTTNSLNTQITQKESLVNSTTDSEIPRLRDRTDRAWFSHVIRHPARKRNRSILTTPAPARDWRCWCASVKCCWWQ